MRCSGSLSTCSSQCQTTRFNQSAKDKQQTEKSEQKYKSSLLYLNSPRIGNLGNKRAGYDNNCPNLQKREMGEKLWSLYRHLIYFINKHTEVCWLWVIATQVWMASFHARVICLFNLIWSCIWCLQQTKATNVIKHTLLCNQDSPENSTCIPESPKKLFFEVTFSFLS
jgi:hypothetical protein